MDILLLVMMSTYEIMCMDLVCVCVCECLFVCMFLFVGALGGEVGVGNPFFNERNRA